MALRDMIVSPFVFVIFAREKEAKKRETKFLCESGMKHV